jgi:hypothetical protein
MIYTTLNRVRRWSPDATGWRALLEHLGKRKGDKNPVSFAAVLVNYGLYDTLLCTRAAPEYACEWRLFAVWCARQVQYLMTDTRSIAAIDVAERYAHGRATAAELQAACLDAWKAVQSAPEGTAKVAAREAAHGTTLVNASLSAYSAALAAADAVARCATRPVESNTFRRAAADAQKAEFLRIVKENGE